MAVLGAWLAGVWASGGGHHRRTRVAVVLAFGIVTLWSAAVFGELGDRGVRSGVLAGSGAVREQFGKMKDYLTTRPPIEAWNERESVALRTLAEWLRACTAPSDRLLIVGWAADLYFYAERPFAGGQVYLYPEWHSSIADQELTVARLIRQRVPVAIAPVASLPMTRQSFPIVLDHLDRHYVHVLRGTFGSPWEYDVLVRRDLPSLRTYEPLDLPCYR